MRVRPRLLYSPGHAQYIHYNRPLTISGTVLKSLITCHFCLIFDTKMTFEKRLRSVSWAASQRLGILRKSWRVFHDRSLLGRCFRGFVLCFLEYCCAVWCSSADTHLKLLDRVVSGARSCSPCIRWCGGAGGFQEQGQNISIGLSCFIPFCVQLFFPFSPFCLSVGIVVLWSLDW